MKNIRAVLFDFDGTLVDTNQIVFDSWQEVFRTVEGAERPAEVIYSTYGEPLFETMEHFFGEKTEMCIKIYRDYQSAIYLDTVKLYPGMEALIARLKRKGYKLAVVTSRLKKSTIEILDKYALTDSFDAVITCDDTDKHKPDPEPALAALEKLGTAPAQAIMVGDSRYDVGCGKNAGIKTVLMNWSVTFEGAVQCEPDYIIGKAEELEDLLEELC